jgi:hypothetical protein
VADESSLAASLLMCKADGQDLKAAELTILLSCWMPVAYPHMKKKIREAPDPQEVPVCVRVG